MSLTSSRYLLVNLFIFFDCAILESTEETCPSMSFSGSWFTNLFLFWRMASAKLFTILFDADRLSFSCGYAFSLGLFKERTFCFLILFDLISEISRVRPIGGW